MKGVDLLLCRICSPKEYFKIKSSEYMAYNIKHDLTNVAPHQCEPCGQKCDSCDNFVASQSYVIFSATRKSITYVGIALALHQMLYIWHVPKKCKKQGVGSTISWIPRLRNYESQIKNNVCSCRIVTHFIDECSDEEIPFKYLAFAIMDVVNNNV